MACGDVEDLARTNAKRVMIRGEVDLDGLPGIRDQQSTDDGVSFLYSGDLDQLTRHLASGHITDLSVTEPDLEEIFLHYYAEGGDV